MNEWWLCPNTPRCGHGAVLHDVEDREDLTPRCCVEGCRCGARDEGPAAFVVDPGIVGGNTTAALIAAGYTAASVADAVRRDDLAALVHPCATPVHLRPGTP